MDYSSYLGVSSNYDTTACMVAAAAAANNDNHQAFSSTHYPDFNACGHSQVGLSSSVAQIIRKSDSQPLVALHSFFEYYAFRNISLNKICKTTVYKL